MSKWSDRYSAVVQATRKGLLKKASEMTCAGCQKPAKHRHHDDYSKPLEVVYLCVACHDRRHKELGWGIKGAHRHYNFSRIPIGAYGLVPGSISRVSVNVHNHSVRTGERFKCFKFDDKRIAVFRLSITAAMARRRAQQQERKAQEKRDMVARKIQKRFMPTKKTLVIARLWLEGKSHGEIASQLNLSRGGLGVRIVKLRQRFPALFPYRNHRCALKEAA